MSFSAVIGALRVNLGIDSAQFTNGLRNAQKSMTNFGASMMKWGGVLTATVTTPLVAIGKGMIDAASDAAESASAFDFLFKDQAASTRKWADEVAAAIGRSTYALQGQALAFQQYFSQVAPTNAKAAELSKSFTLLAQDLASFYNVTEGDALEKLRSGLAGEAEPLRAFGVFLSAAAVEAKALEMGLMGANDELTEQEKVLARAAVIMEQTTSAQGDAARTAGSFANQSKALTAALQDVGIKLGTILLPFAQKLVVMLTEATRWFSELSPRTQEWIVITAGIAAVLGPVLIGLGALAAAIAFIGPPVAAAVAGITALTAAIVALWPELTAAWTAFEQSWDAMVTKVHAVKDSIVEFAASIPGIFVNLAAQMVEIGGQIIDGLWQGIQARWESVKASVTGLASGIAQSIRDTLGIQSPSRVMHEVGVNIMQGLNNGMASMSGVVGETATGMGDTVAGVFESLGGALAGFLDKTKSTSEKLKGLFKALLNSIMSMMGSGGGPLGGLFKGILGGLIGFRNGGTILPGGSGGVDSQLVMFRKSPNEQVDITKPGQRRVGGGVSDVRVWVDQDGNWQAAVERIAQGPATRAAAKAVSAIPSVSEKTRNDGWRKLRPQTAGGF
jgi:hypothetical protein